MSASRFSAWLKAHEGFLKPKQKKGAPHFDDQGLLRLKVLADLYRKGHSEAFIKELTERFSPGELVYEQVLAKSAPKPAKQAAAVGPDAMAMNQTLLLLMDVHERIGKLEKAAAKPPPAPPAPPPLNLGPLVDRLEDLVKGVGEILDKQNHQMRLLRHETRVALETLSGTLDNQNTLFSGFLHEDTTTKDDLRAILMHTADKLSELAGNVGDLLTAEQETKEMHHRMVSETRNLLRSLEEMDASERKSWVRSLKRQS